MITLKLKSKYRISQREVGVCHYSLCHWYKLQCVSPMSSCNTDKEDKRIINELIISTIRC